MFDTLFENIIVKIDSGILVVDINGKINLANYKFCEIFETEQTSEALIGCDRSIIINLVSKLYPDAESFITRVIKDSEKKNPILNNELHFTNGKIVKTDYIPLIKNNEYIGNFWMFADITENKLNETRLKEIEHRYTLLSENSISLISIHDKETLFKDVSSNVKSILGYNESELIGKDIYYLIHPDDINITKKQIHAIFDKGDNHLILQFRLKKKDGTFVWFESAIAYAKNGTEFSDIIVTSRNIARRIKTESEIKKLSSIVEKTNNAVTITDPEGKIEWVNNAFTKMTGYTLAELIGKKPGHLLQGKETNKETADFIRESLKARKPFECEIINYKKNGEKFWSKIQIQPLFDEDGNLKNFFAIEEDITNTISKQQKIKQSEEKYRSILENMELGVLEVDLKGIVLNANKSFCEITGYSSEELIGKNPVNFLIPDDEYRIKIDKNNSIRNSGESSVYEVMLIRKDGKLINVLISGGPIYDENKKVTGSIGIHLDITQQKQTETNLIIAQQKSLASVNAKQLFLANMSHEIRTPMNAIIGMTNLLKKTPLNVKQHSYVEALINTSHNLLAIVNDILDFTKIETNQLKVSNTTFSISTITHQVYDLFNIKAEEKDIDFKLSLDNQVNDYLISDSLRIIQILNNLVSNAIKFTQAKGNIKLSYKLIIDNPKYQTIEFNVTDNGIGIAEDKLDNIFESFNQENETISQKYGGTGLGLAISKQLVELLGGKIFIKSTKNEGTSVGFVLTLEKGNEDQISERNEIAINSKVLQNKRILLAEDSVINQTLCLAILEDWGVITDIAENGKQAINRINNNDYDLILMDVRMPELDGIGATRIIRNSIDRHIPIIALTANAISGDNEKCIEAGMNDYLIKPFTEIDLFIKICTALKLDSNKEIVIKHSTQLNKSEKLFSVHKLEESTKGDQAFINKMLDIFIEEVPKTVSEAQIAFSENDIVKVKFMLHKIKPSIMIMSINSILNNIDFVEELKLDDAVDQMNTIKKNLDEIESVIHAVVIELKQNKEK